MRLENLQPPTLTRVSEIIAERTGLHFPPERHSDLRRALDEAAPALGCHDGAACVERLLASPPSTAELRLLARHLTIGETYFFRERPSFNALATHVLPPLIHRKRAGEKRLRLWSAACSTGEEAYSLAILIQQVLPDWRDWNISILGTDINAEYLRKAESAVYGPWSFRESPPDFRDRYFEIAGNRTHRVRADVRELVTFAELNLAQDHFPSIATDTNAMDLILCRNLLIYFTPAHARRLVTGLRNALVEDGWLIVSPSECSQGLFTGFVPVNLPGSILYRKRRADETELPDPFAAVSGLPAPLTQQAVASLLETAIVAAPLDMPVAPEDPHAAVLAEARALYDSGRYPECAARLQPALGEGSDARLLALYAHALANQGDLDAALAASARWIAADKLDPAAHYLHAMVLQELGQRAPARAALQRAIYLQPDFALAHFALGNAARAEARHPEAERHFANAAQLLRGHSADEIVPESEGLNVGRLREIITALLRGADA